MNDDPIEIQEWLRRLKWALTAIPEPERDDILEETRAHLNEAIGSGKAPAEALAGFGLAEDYAHGFVQEMELAGALGSRRTGEMLSVVGRRVSHNGIAAVAGFLLLMLGAGAFVAALMLVLKLSDPAHTGLWRGPHAFFIGRIDDPSTANDLLGYWLYPAAVATVAISWLVSRFVLLWALRSITRAR